MINSARLGYSVFAGLIFSALAISAGAAATSIAVITQPPCLAAGDFCKSFTSNAPIPTIRTISFNAPGPGRALVNFHGSMFCAGESVLMLSETFARVDFVSQIVEGNAAPNLRQPGSLRHAAGLAEIGEVVDWSTSFNLSSARLFAVNAAGQKTYAFRITRLLQDQFITCFVYNATFTIQFMR